MFSSRSFEQLFADAADLAWDSFGARMDCACEFPWKEFLAVSADPLYMLLDIALRPGDGERGEFDLL